jgi:hypothetical protein
MHVESRVGTKKQRDHFTVPETPAHVVSVENRNGDECDVEVEVISGSDCVLVDNEQSWRSPRMTHGGLRDRETRKWPYRASLSFVKDAPGRPQVLTIKVYMDAVWADDDEPLTQIGEFKHTIWVA